MGIKQADGITLVALVITIIVLLILAGVTISMVSGEKGLISRAKNATTKWNEAEKDELDKIDTAVDAIDNVIKDAEKGT